MMKQMKKYFTITFKVVVFLAFLLVSLNPKSFNSYANAKADLYECGQRSFERLESINPFVSLQRSVDDIIWQTTLSSTIGAATNYNLDEMCTCSMWDLQNRIDSGNIGEDDLEKLFEDPELGGENRITPQTIQDAWQAAEDNELDCNFEDPNGNAKGSLLGVTKLAMDVASKEPLPVNLAYYAKHNLQKIPYVKNTALAATSYNVFGMELVLGLTETTRSIAYAMMSVIMLVLGIMIITRKSISSNYIVTIQTALPRVVISLLLITFSYPIGGIIGSLANGLIPFVLYFFFLNNAQAFGLQILTTFFGIFSFIFGVDGWMGLALTGLWFIATLIILLFVFLKMILINTKLIIAIILAPIQFAIGAIPGQEEVITKWFKQMLAYALSVPAMWAMIGISWTILLAPVADTGSLANLVNVIQNPVSTGLAFVRTKASSFLSVVMVPIMSIIIMSMTLKVDKIVQEFIVGDSKPKRR